MKNLLDLIESEIHKNDNKVFILNCFHISFAYASKFRKNLRCTYQEIISRLRNLPSIVLINLLEKKEMQSRTKHKERGSSFWQEHREKRLKESNLNSFEELYLEEQDLILRIVKKQKIPYHIIKT